MSEYVGWMGCMWPGNIAFVKERERRFPLAFPGKTASKKASKDRETKDRGVHQRGFLGAMK